MARIPHAIPATFIKVQRWPGVSRRSRRGATHPSLAQPAHLQSPAAVRVSHRAFVRASFSAAPPAARYRRVPCVTKVPGVTVRDMPGPSPSNSHDLNEQLARIVHDHNVTTSTTELRKQLAELAASATPDALIAAAEPHRDDPEVIAPFYEVVVAAQPDNARALVVLANAYWLQGRGPQVVGELATKAIAADPANRGAWHLWALSESDPRARVRRWQQVSERFPSDHLALAAVADNAASVAGAEHDYSMLDFAIGTYERLLEQTSEPAQREAVSTALSALRGWRF